MVKRTTRDFDDVREDNIFAIELPDEALEVSAGTGNEGFPKIFTVAACTGLSACLP